MGPTDLQFRSSPAPVILSRCPGTSLENDSVPFTWHTEGKILKLCVKQIANSQIALETSLREDLIGEDSHVSMSGTDGCVLTEPQKEEMDRGSASVCRKSLSEEGMEGLGLANAK